MKRSSFERRIGHILVAGIILPWALVACSSQGPSVASPPPRTPASQPSPPSGVSHRDQPSAASNSERATPITATIEARSGAQTRGQVSLAPAGSGVHVVVTVASVSPGVHGIHFHETGDCSAADGTSAKGHYNPQHFEHGLPEQRQRHLGDLGNIVVAANGEGRLEFDLVGATLEPNAPNGLRGRALILHEKADDGSQPTGNSGARIGCAAIP